MTAFSRRKVHLHSDTSHTVKHKEKTQQQQLFHRRRRNNN
jgi:hypothetical protein